MANNNDPYAPEKILFHTDKINDLKKRKQIVPTSIELHLEAWCNDNCSFCSFRKEKGTNLGMLKLINGNSSTDFKPIGSPSENSRIPFETVMKLPKQMKECGIPACLISGGGESTLYPKFDEVIKEFARHGIELALITNGTVLSYDRLFMIARHFKWIRFSMDSSTEGLHKEIHKTSNKDFERRINKIKDLIIIKKELRSDLVIGISFIVTKENIEDIEDSTKFYHSLGVDNIRFSYMFDMLGNGGLTKLEIEIVKQTIELLKQEYPGFIFGSKDRIDLYSKPNDDFNICSIQHFSWIIGADAKLYPCCIMAYHEEFAIADLNKKSIKGILSSKIVWNKMFSLDPKSCLPCWLREKNQVVERAMEKPIHVNFL